MGPKKMVELEGPIGILHKLDSSSLVGVKWGLGGGGGGSKRSIPRSIHDNIHAQLLSWQ